jgi:hypothetical protein
MGHVCRASSQERSVNLYLDIGLSELNMSLAYVRGARRLGCDVLVE